MVVLAAGPLTAQRPLPAWTRGATCYEVFVRSFKDSDGDGIGDLKGLIEKLDYIRSGKPGSRTDLGANCIWLMPVAESPSYHGYDVSDYYRIEKDYGTNDDFKRLMKEAHKRGIRVLVDMVLNHSSSEHPYFQAALHDTTSPYRAWYRWSPTRPSELNPWGQSNWHKSPVRDEWFYAFFWSGMPDLNYENPAVVAEAKKIARFWLKDMGADGFRLDAVSYLIEEPAHINHSPGTHRVLHEYGDYVRGLSPNSYTVGEVSDPTPVLYDYYPNQLDSYFAFELADSLVAAVNRGSAGGVLNPVLTLQQKAPEAHWSPFLRNHDQPRTLTELHGDVQKARVAATLLLAMPGVPFVYYGEEIGMTGAKPDERLRTPMQWTNAAGGGFTTGKAWESFQADSAATTVSAQDADSTSLLNLYRRLIHTRSANVALGSGRLVPLTTADAGVVAFIRRSGTHAVLAIANLSATAREGVTVTSDSGAVAKGRWDLRSLLDNTRANPVTVGADGRIASFAPTGVLAPQTAYLFDLTAHH